MHDGYAGDHKDYYKFIILKALAQKARCRISVCWMLTSPRGSGNDDTSYLKDKLKWVRSPECEEIFQAFDDCVNGSPPKRTVAEIERKGLIPGANYFSEMLTGKPEQAYWTSFDRHLGDTGADLIFFDPNTGVQQKPTIDHLDFERIQTYYEREKSILVIQFHTDRSKKVEDFIQARALEIIVSLSQGDKILDPDMLWCFWGKTLTGNANVLFYLMAQEIHKDRMTPVIAHLKRLWKGCHLKRSKGGIQPCFTVKAGSEMFKKRVIRGRVS